MEQYLPRLRELEARFGEYRQRLDDMIGEQRRLIDHTVITKGPIGNHTPFFNERTGMKVRKKVLKAPVASDDCQLNHYDAQGRLIQVEEFLPCANGFRVIELYRYGERAERLFLSSERLARLEEFDRPFSDTQLSLSFAGENGYIAEEFRYDGGVLTEILVKRPAMTERHVFQYDGATLAQIVRVCGNGYREVAFSTKKPDFEKIRRELTARLLEAVGEQGEFACIGIEGFLDQARPMACACFTKDPEPPELIADWGCPMTDIVVSDYQFSDTQLRKCVKLIAEILIQLVQEGVLDGKGIRFHQNQVCVHESFPAVRAMLKKAGLEVR